MPPELYIVRPAVPDDLLAAVRLIGGTPDLGDDQVSNDQRETWRRMMRTDGLALYLADRDGESVGYTASLQMPHLTYDCRPTVFIESMHVLQAHRRRGVARRLVERVLSDARAAGCHKVQLLTHKRHATDGAHDFYRSLGFVAEAEGFRLYLE
ncbi:MAG: GNAT family N-acetyltransferase [Acidimicrobiales bacterium]|nr:GNAT family N-acetyltransferase [Acidimicrobiales bacterium]